MDLRKSLGERIRYHRKAKKISQERLAEMTELSVTFIGTSERGGNCPSLKSCQKIAEALGVPLWELFAFEGWSAEEKKIAEFISRLRRVDPDKADLILAIGEALIQKFQAP